MLKRFLQDNKGVAAIEFVFLIPIFLIILITGFEVARYLMVMNKLQSASYALSNVVAQTAPATLLNRCSQSRLSEGTLRNITSGMTSLMSPFSQDNGSDTKVIVTSLQKTSGGYQVVWRQENGALATDVKSEISGTSGAVAFTDPKLTTIFAPLQNGENLLVLEAFYRYKPIFPRIFGAVSDTFTERTIAKHVYFYNRLGKAIYLPPGVPVVGEIPCGSTGS